MASADIASIPAVTEISGANQKMALSASSGMMSSLMSNLTASAMGCSKPCGPTRIGPSRACMSAMILRSINTMYPAISGRTATITIMQTSGTQIEIANWRTFIIMALPVNLSQNNIQRADDGHNVGHQMSANHLVEGF